MYARAHRQAIITPPDAWAGGLVTRFCRPSAAVSGQQLRVSTRRLPGASDPDQSRGCQDVCVSSSSTAVLLQLEVGVVGFLPGLDGLKGDTLLTEKRPESLVADVLSTTPFRTRWSASLVSDQVEKGSP